MERKSKFIAVSLIPTGIRCDIGGYIGDATIPTNELASVCDFLITNPNAVNAGAFNFKADNVLYVEGFAVDQLFEGKISLSLPKKNKVGVIVEKSSDFVAKNYFLKTLEAYEVVAGIQIEKVVYIPPLKKTIHFQNGQFCADIKNIEPLIKAAKDLKESGVDAIAVSTQIPFSKPDLRRYQQSEVPNPYGLIEALISHTVIASSGLPSAHGPLLTREEIDFYIYESFKADARAAFENISGAYVGSVLLGLDKAPSFLPVNRGEINVKDINALIVPSHCLRSIPVAYAIDQGIPIIEVAENKTIFKDNPFKITEGMIQVKSYKDAVKVLEKLRI